MCTDTRARIGHVPVHGRRQYPCDACISPHASPRPPFDRPLCSLVRPQALLSDPWNQLDLAVVLFAWLPLLFPSLDSCAISSVRPRHTMKHAPRAMVALPCSRAPLACLIDCPPPCTRALARALVRATDASPLAVARFVAVSGTPLCVRCAPSVRCGSLTCCPACASKSTRSPRLCPN